MNIKEQIIARLDELQMSTEEVGDILGKTGVVKGVYPIHQDTYMVGEVQYFYGHTNSNWPIHDQVRQMEPGKIAFIDTIFVDDYALFGELVSTFIIQYKKAKGIIANGLMRDLAGMRQRGYAVWCKGITPIGCFNMQVNENAEVKRHAQKGKEYYDGAIAVCDDSGVVIIPKESINENFLQRIDQMAEQEKTWFDCVENRGWDTYDTVCLKKYKEN